MALGSYPQVFLATVRRAREEAREVLKRVIDPVAAKKEARLTCSQGQPGKQL